jgi:putative ABC transport system permease protein
MQPNAQINRIFIQTEPDREPRTLVKEVEKALGERLDRNTFSVLTQQDLLKLVFKLMGILTWLLTGLTSIALFVGGVGIMTVMLMSVHERTKEIGIRKAFGAKRRDIFWQFLAEALLLALVGVAAGLGVSAAACWALAKWTLLKPTITAGIVALAVSVCALVGAVFGIAPAMRAASRDPVSSLRYE